MKLESQTTPPAYGNEKPPEQIIEELRSALQPFADCVFNDNHDLTVETSRICSQHYRDAYWAMRRHRP